MRPLPLEPAEFDALTQHYPTPFYLYDAAGIAASARALHAAFADLPGFCNYFAVKATPTPQIMALLAAEGCGMDCSSLPELLLAERIGMHGERIMFSSNNTPAAEYAVARRLGALINLDALDQLPFLAAHAGLPPLVCFRYNPGALREGNAIIGRPEEAKFGCTREQLVAGYAAARDQGVQRFGLHTMLASNERDPHYFITTAHMLFEQVAELSATLNIRFEFVNLGGGIGIPYRPGEQPVDLQAIAAGVHAAYQAQIVANGLHPLRVFLECGRLLTGPHGWLITRVRHLKQTYRRYAGVDATMADLMRPGMYGAYHHLSVIGKQNLPADTWYDVVGSLCENNDKFAVNRQLPRLEAGDLLAIHDAGAHGRAMGFNYNGKLRPAELLLAADGSVRLMRRAETIDDYFATLVWEA
ncbi:MAG TPA: diaminopimelate decarboxylase [Roseiflexaceae bacterium]|nr:diaminopimelate decarboxylase [Roseiflexaceae bacterium]